MTEHIITQSEKDLLIKMYYDGNSFEEMYKESHIPRRKIQAFFKDRDMNLVKRYSMNETYFNSIDTEEKAYWLGYMYCDGFVGSGKYNNIVLASIDEEVVDSFLDELDVRGKEIVKKVYPANHKNRQSSFAKSTLFEARFSSKEMKQALMERNIFPNRKDRVFLKYKDIEENLFKYIIFGIIDADAYVSLKNNKTIIHTYSSNELLEDYKKLFDSQGLSYSVKYNVQKDCRYLRLLLNNNTRNFINEYLNYSKIERKNIAPSLSKDSVEQDNKLLGIPKAVLTTT